ncbi:MAG: hypothetical protein PHU88_01725 [candidate division Zixibacteria bacterium]|nr:hypothetical protein [candidate division Zixibacteria bacterium]
MLITSKLIEDSVGPESRTKKISLEITGTSHHPTLISKKNNHELVAIGTREYISETTNALSNDIKFISNDFVDIKFEYQGALILCDNSRGKIYIHSDILGLIPVYWQVSENTISISDSLYQLYSACPGEVDEVGVIEFMRFGYTIGQRTFFRNIKCLRPGETLRFDYDSNTVALRDLSHLWKEPLRWERKKIIEVGCELMTEACRPMADTMLMISAGWDSRALLAGAFAAGVGDSIKTYHHGDLESRECRIVKKMTARCKLPLMLHQIEPADFDNDFLARRFQIYNSVVFPHWHVASRMTTDSGHKIESVSAGIIGENIGGHFGSPTILSGWKKIASTLTSMLKAPSFHSPKNPRETENLLEVTTYFHQSPYDIPWYIKAEIWQERFSSIHEQVNGDIEQTMNRYVQRGIETREAIIEAFLTEHLGSKYWATQLHSAATFKPILAPFGHRSLIDYSSRVPYEFKITNTLTQAIIKRLYPRLLEFPTAAVLCKAKNSILLQESSRIVRKASEQGLKVTSRLIRGKTPQFRLGWLNFDFLEQKPVVHELIHGLSSPLWDKEKMEHFFNYNKQVSGHDIMNMLLKIKTLDLFKIE